MAKKDDNKTTAQKAAEAEAGPEVLKKLSAKTITGRITRPKKDDAPKSLYRVWGIAVGKKTGVSNFGPWVAISGSFEAVNIESGALYQGTQLFLPDAVTSQILVGLDAAQKNDAGATLQFALEVGIKYSDVPIGYEYTVRPLVKPQGGDPLAAIREQVKALPAPK